MKMKFPVILNALILALILSLAFASPALAAPAARSVFGETYTLHSGETLDEDLNIFGGMVTLEDGSTVNGDVSLTGGSLSAQGEINGDLRITGGVVDLNGTLDGEIEAMGGVIRLSSEAHVTGDIVDTGSMLSMDEGAQVDGEIRDRLFGSNVRVFPFIGGVRFGHEFDALFAGLWFIAQVLIVSALALLLGLFFEKPLRRTAGAAVSQPLLAGGLGLFTLVIAPFALLLMIITILLIPVAFLAAAGLVLVALFGWVALGYEVGERLARMFHQTWAAPLSAGLGTFVMSFILLAVGWIPCVGWLLVFFTGLVGLGAVLLTRFGTQDYSDAPAVSSRRTTAPAVVATYAAPVEPAAAEDDPWAVPPPAAPAAEDTEAKPEE